MKKPTKTAIARMEAIVKKSFWTPIEKAEALDFVQKYVNDTTQWCMRCDSSVRLMFGQLKNYLTKIKNQNENL